MGIDFFKAERTLCSLDDDAGGACTMMPEADNINIPHIHRHVYTSTARWYNSSMFECRVEADFAAAHFLKDYHGKCENLHGHNYKVYAHVRGTKLDEGGMLVDFGVLKASLRKTCSVLDHTNLNDLTENGTSTFRQNPSAERIAMWIFNRMKEELLQTAPEAAELLYAVDVFETPGSRARYIPD